MRRWGKGLVSHCKIMTCASSYAITFVIMSYLLCSIIAMATSSLSLEMARSSTFWLNLFDRISCSFTDKR